MTQIYTWLESGAPWLGQLSPLFAATCAALLLVGGAAVARRRSERLGRVTKAFDEDAFSRRFSGGFSGGAPGSARGAPRVRAAGP